MSANISFEINGSFDKTFNFLKRLEQRNFYNDLERYAKEGVDALKANTPVDKGLAANSWSYNIKRDKNGCSISWNNSDVVSGTPIIILLQYGHGTGTGGYVSGRDFINPSIKPIFDRISEKVWQEVKK